MAKYLITSALPYINGTKHLGNLIGSMLPADVHARFQRMGGHEVVFICATDEHGTPAELAAAEAGMTPRAYCDMEFVSQRDVYKRLDLSFDYFGRTSGKANAELTRHLSRQLEAAGLVEERSTNQIYSIDDGRFLPDRYVEGTCPHCGFEKARGDQCDNCGRLVEPTDLISPRSRISGSQNLELRATKHLFLLQSKLAETLRTWVDGRNEWPSLARSIAYKWLDEGLQDRSITRDLAWGVAVSTPENPRQGFENKVYYVWFDAPIGYIAVTQDWAESVGKDWKPWWLNDHGAKDVTYIEFMGKDNVAFHSVSFPATLIGSGEDWKLVDRLKALNWLTWYGDKFSTSSHRGVFLDDALELLPADYWRWYLVARAPESSDSDFTWDEFQTVINSDLCNVFGNFINRVVQFTLTRFEGKVPEGGTPGPIENELFEKLAERLQRLGEMHQTMEFRKAAAETRAIWVLGNEYLQSSAPWTTLKTDKEAAGMAIRVALNLCALFAAIAYPVIPSTAAKVLGPLGASSEPVWPKGKEDFLTFLTPGAAIESAGLLFNKIEDASVAEWKERFGI